MLRVKNNITSHHIVLHLINFVLCILYLYFAMFVLFFSFLFIIHHHNRKTMYLHDVD